jgi:hypothetical protein
MTFSLVGMLISAMLSTMMLPPIAERSQSIQKVAIFFQWIFLPITLILFGALPALDAQARLMLGQYMGFWVTEKRR